MFTAARSVYKTTAGLPGKDLEKGAPHLSKRGKWLRASVNKEMAGTGRIE